MPKEINDIVTSNSANFGVMAQKNIHEYQDSHEQNSPQETAKIAEFDSKFKNKSKNKLQNVFAGIISTAVLAITGVVPILPNKNMISIERYNIECYSNMMYYEFELKQSDNFDNITVEVYNDFVNYSNKFEDNIIENVVENLKPNFSYTICIKNNGTIIFEQKVKTTSERNNPNSYRSPKETQPDDQTAGTSTTPSDNVSGGDAKSDDNADSLGS